MNSIEISVITFALVFGGALLGVFIQGRLREHHQNADTKDVVRLGMGLVGTVAALVLGLLISSANSYYDNQRDELTQMSANIVMLGRLLQHYGPEANAAHESLRLTVGRILVDKWPAESREKLDVLPPTAKIENLFDQVHNLVPKNEVQRAMQSQASSLLVSLGQMRWLMYAQASTTISRELLCVMILWLISIFLSWGMYSPSNTITLTTFFVSALSVSCAILVILELYSPYKGLLHLSSAPLRLAYAALSQ